MEEKITRGNFEVFDPMRRRAYVSVTERGVFRLNAASRRLLGQPRYVTLHYDVQTSQAGLKAVGEDEPSAYKVSRPGSTISARAFLKYFGLALPKHMERYPAEMQGEYLVFKPK